MDTETLIANAFLDLVQQGDSTALFAIFGYVRYHMKVLDMSKALFESSELVKMRCKQAETANIGSDVSAIINLWSQGELE